ncbi:MAG TPA: chorismate synthase [bacterium]|nr:chorismate synthase [bacterium]
MNSFGRIFRVSILGESHGEQVGVVIDGCPAGLELAPEDFADDLARRRADGQFTTARKEPDEPLMVSGLFDGRTTGAPLTILFQNRDIRSKDYFALKNTPRPGHADHTAYLKTGGWNDYRGGGHFSGRLTLGLVAAGVVAKKLLDGVTIAAEILEIGGAQQPAKRLLEAQKEGDSLGGIIRCVATGLPAGLGEPFFDSVESLVSHIVFSIPGIKGIEFGAGFAAARMNGSEVNDAILDKKGRTLTNNAGGVNGGITSGNPLVFRIAARPTPSIRLTQQTVNLETGKKTEITIAGRHDTCFALRLPPILEGVTAIVLADLMLREGKLPRVLS